MSGGALRSFIHLDDGLKQILHPHSRLERRWHDGHSQECGKRLQVGMIAASFKLIIHIQRTHHSNVHVYQLGRQIEVALQVRGVNDVDDDVGRLFRKMLPHIEFFRRIAGQRVSAGQVCQ